MDTTAAKQQQAWPTQPEAMSHIDTDLTDLENLFEFGDIGLGTAVDSAQFGDHNSAHGTHPHTPYEELSEAQAIAASTSAQDFAAHEHFVLSQMVDQHSQSQYNHHVAPTSNPFSTDALYQSSLQQQAYANQQQQFTFTSQPGFPPGQHVPPTPNSYEMHGEAGRFLQSQLDQQQRAVLEQRFGLRKEDAIAYTPLASPAGTPQYNVPPEYTIPGAYFSPLTSPMLHAQNGQPMPQQHQQQRQQQQHHQGYYTNPSTAPTSNATSPLDPNTDFDMLNDDLSLPESTSGQSRKSVRKKIPTPRSVGPLARVKQSPIQKAIKRKSTTMLSTMVPSSELDSAMDIDQSRLSQPMSAGLQMPAQFRNDSSDNGSISPEPLSEALMGPPPRPRSRLTQSPAIRAQQQAATASALGAAATPKSLLSIRNGAPVDMSKQSNTGRTGQPVDNQTIFEELQLPDAAAPNAARPALPHLDTQIRLGQVEDAAQASSRKTPKLGPSSTPSSARPSNVQSFSVAGSPMLSPAPGALAKEKKSDLKSRSNKKRGSIGGGSIMVSPALRPRISPSIKPLLPEGAVHSPTHALLLASKSNYQNLLEGNHLPGVSYPDSLSTGLTSKRTSHKVAEQGRRNRINEALKEMQSLLPRPPPTTSTTKSTQPSTNSTANGTTNNNSSNSDASPDATNELDEKDTNGKDDASTAAAKSNSSKAATVESANEYIRKLQLENAALLQIKKEHEEWKRRLGESGIVPPGLEGDVREGREGEVVVVKDVGVNGKVGGRDGEGVEEGVREVKTEVESDGTEGESPAE